MGWFARLFTETGTQVDQQGRLVYLEDEPFKVAIDMVTLLFKSPQVKWVNKGVRTQVTDDRYRQSYPETTLEAPTEGVTIRYGWGTPGSYAGRIKITIRGEELKIPYDADRELRHLLHEYGCGKIRAAEEDVLHRQLRSLNESAERILEQDLRKSHA